MRYHDSLREDRPRIAWIHQNFVDRTQAGNSRPFHITRVLCELGWRVDVITGQSGYLDDNPCNGHGNVAVERKGHLTIHRLPIPGRHLSLSDRKRAYLHFSKKALHYGLGMHDIGLVYCSVPPLPQALPGILLSARRNVPMVLEVRDLWPAFLVDAGLLTGRGVILAMEWIESLAYHYADHVIPVAPSYTRYLKAMGVAVKKTTVIPTGGDPHFIEKGGRSGVDWRRANGLGREFLMLYAGSFNEYYGLDMVIEAARRLEKARPDIKWIFAGNGRCCPAIKQAAETLGNVCYLGAVGKNDLQPVYDAADGGLISLAPYPLLEAMLPGKLFDYLAAGIPVVSTVKGQVGEIVKSAGAGVALDDVNAECLAGVVTQLADLTVGERRAMGRRGKEWVRVHMNTYVMARWVADTVDSVYSKRSGSKRKRLLVACAKAFWDGARLRSRRTIKKYYSSLRATTIRTSFEDWINQSAVDERED